MQLLLLCQLFTISILSAAILPREPQTTTTRPIWQPMVGSKYQIILDRNVINSGRLGRVEQLVPENAEIFDVDLFDTSREIIQQLHARGKKVICYFSAGGSESWRPDYKDIKAKDKGEQLKGWERESWLDVRSEDVFNVMKKRIQMAGQKGCDGIDPDNIDAFGDESKRGGGFPVKLTQQDSITYIKKLAAEAHANGLAMGLKNAEMIINSVSKDIEFAVNEECATYYGGCRSYEPFLNSGKPVFHIEYARTTINGTKVDIVAENSDLKMTNAELQKLYCLETGIENRRWISPGVAKKFSTVIKALQLNKWVLYCDGTSAGDAKDAINGGG